MIAIESMIMFVSSMVVFVHIALGGVVGLDIRRSICLRDLLFGALLSILVSFYTITKFFFLSSVERKNLYDTHLIVAIINLILLENLLMNRSAMAYWKQISCRLMNNWPALRSNKVAATLTNEKAACGLDLGSGEEAEPGKASHQRIQPTVATQISPFTVIDVDDGNISAIHSCMCTAEKESNSAIFQRDDYIRPTDSQNENREMSTNLPKIIVVQPRYDPS